VNWAGLAQSGSEVSYREALYGLCFRAIWIVGFALFTLVPLMQTLFYSMNQVTVEATGIDLVCGGVEQLFRRPCLQTRICGAAESDMRWKHWFGPRSS